MKATELRIGNLVNFNTQECIITESDLLDLKKHPEKYSPIPTSEKILNRFGFYKVGLNSYHKDECIEIGISFHFSGYAHELQNEYYKKMGVELTIKETEKA